MKEHSVDISNLPPSSSSAEVLRPLKKLEPTLPSRSYYEIDFYQSELEHIWWQDWVCIGRSTDLLEKTSFKTVSVGGQSLIVLRNEQGELKAFHNTCRHRGSLLCERPRGEFENGRIVCPYHAWTYSLDGKLTHTPWRLSSDDFHPDDFGLYDVSVGEWGGNVFVNLSRSPALTLDQRLAEIPSLFGNWHLESAVSGFKYEKEVNCNWKIFWENFTECYHCPGIHPELCQVVPRYGNGVVRSSDHPDWDEQTGPDLEAEPRLGDGMVTWSDDGQTDLPFFPYLSSYEKRVGQTFGTLMPSCFFAAHVDFVRLGYITPLEPERTRVVIECLFPSETIESGFDISSATRFIERLTNQDLRVCELNQRGLRSHRHMQGVLVPQEYYTYQFQQWVRSRLL